MRLYRKHRALSTFPTTNQPVLEHALKEMLLSLKKDLQAEICKNISNVQACVDQLERKELAVWKINWEDALLHIIT